MEHDINGDGKMTDADIIKTPLKQNGDFRSDECIEILKECDVVITNPPFSLFREYLAQLIEYKKKFLIVGNLNAISYKDVFPYIESGVLWIGTQRVKSFRTPISGEVKNIAAIWFTNLDHVKRHELLRPCLVYNEVDYPKYDDQNIIDVGRVTLIPKDYHGKMGVPISFLEKHNPDQFEILGFINGAKLTINGKHCYDRIIIKTRQGVQK